MKNAYQTLMKTGATAFQSLLLLGVFSFDAFGQTDNNHRLTLQMAVTLAQQEDPWIAGNRLRQSALEAKSVASGTLPDPTLSLSMANLPIDGFDFSQEAMTQFKVGINQMFPQGDSLAVRQKQLRQLSQQFPYQRSDRKAQVAIIVSHLWLDAYKAEQSIALIEKSRSLFEQLTDVAQASYSSTIGKTRQQDIVRAQLELTRLEDRLTQLKLAKETSLEKLGEWTRKYSVDSPATEVSTTLKQGEKQLANKVPDIALINHELTAVNNRHARQQLSQILMNHPAVLAIENKITASKTGIELAEQKYKPAWGLSASYGYRDNDPQGNSRADFLSVGVSFEIPFNTSNRQDKEVAAAISNSAAIKTEKWQLMRKMLAQFEATKSQLHRLTQRQQLYASRLLPQMHEQAEASLTAYTNDDGDFSEVVRARIAELNAEIDALAINLDKQKTIVSLNYFLVSNNLDAMVKDQTAQSLVEINRVGEQ